MRRDRPTLLRARAIADAKRAQELANKEEREGVSRQDLLSQRMGDLREEAARLMGEIVQAGTPEGRLAHLTKRLLHVSAMYGENFRLVKEADVAG